MGRFLILFGLSIVGALSVVAMASAIERGAIKPVPELPTAVPDAPLCGEVGAG